ncbi:MAG: plastocyanin/azurin family copper-binding protein [Pseudomonadota bacterium]
MNRRTFVTAVVATLAARAGHAEEAKTHIVEMVSKGARKIFEPQYLEVAVGDTVRFVNLSGTHNTESVDGMIPDGVAPWKSKLKETFDLTITHAGVYGYICTPHLSKAMVGLIVAGDPSGNLEAAKAVRVGKRADGVFEELFTLVPDTK